MTLEELEYFIKEACDSFGCGCIDEDNLPEQLTLVEGNNWEDQGKYQYSYDVYKDDQEPPNHFMITNSRSGSYYSDYEYGQPTVLAVKPVVKTFTKITWKGIK